MVSFWSLLQTNVLDRQRWATRQDLRLAIVVWIEKKTTANDANAQHWAFDQDDVVLIAEVSGPD